MFKILARKAAKAAPSSSSKNNNSQLGEISQTECRERKLKIDIK